MNPEQAPVYLDYAATTPLDPRVMTTMTAYLGRDGNYANPASDHAMGMKANAAVERARQQVADLVGAQPGELIWTAGATEANNLAIKGLCAAQQGKSHIVTCATEHKSVLSVLKYLESTGVRVSTIKPEQDGLLDLNKVEDALKQEATLLSVMHVNNEIGVVQDIKGLGQLAHAHGVLMHVDGAQAAGKLAIDMAAMNIDLLSLSAHKVYGPKGIGALLIAERADITLVPQIHGGGHEGGLRSGTLAPHQIVAMGAAFSLAADEMKEEALHLSVLRQCLYQGLCELGDIELYGHAEKRVAGILNISFHYVDSESLLNAMPELILSRGSACNSVSMEASHVLRALGGKGANAQRDALSAVRFSIGRFTTQKEIDYTIAIVCDRVKKLRQLSLAWKRR